MRIVPWNCQMDFDKKADALFGLKPDVAVISEPAARPFSDRGGLSGGVEQEFP
jgi:hypothetical protein